MTKCCYCGASSGGPLDETLSKLLACNNCRTDLLTHGQWTGIGADVLRDLIKRYGKDAVLEAEKKIMNNGK